MPGLHDGRRILPLATPARSPDQHRVSQRPWRAAPEPLPEIAAEGGLPVRELTSATSPLTEVAEAFALAAEPSAGKVFVAPG